MRIKSTDTEEDDIMPLSDVLDSFQDDDFINQPEIDMAAKKKDAPAPAAEAKETKASKKAAKAAKTETKAKKELPEGFGPRAVPDGHTGLAALCEELDVKPATARRKLRGSEISKPEGQHGWYWKDGSKDLAAVRKALTPAAE